MTRKLEAARIRELEKEVAIWKRRWESECAAHAATVLAFDKLMQPY